MISVPSRRSARLLRLSLCLICGAAVAAATLPRAAAERRLAVMGTWLSVSVEAASRSSALEAGEAAVREIERIDRLLSTWKEGGPLDRLNRAAPDRDVPIGAEASELLARVFGWRERTAGAFDPTVAPLVRAWDLRGEGRAASPLEVSRALEAVGPGHFALDAGGLARRLHPAAGIDEGAWGKGYALDGAAAVLRDRGVRHATLDLGGQVLLLGGGSVAVSDPRERSRIAARIEVSDVSVSTSGNSERARVVAGRRIGHLLDPRTGSPAPDFGSATVASKSAFVADVLSTAFFVLGPEEGMALSRRLASQGIANEALFLVVSDAGVRCVASAGWKHQIVCGGHS